MKLVFIIAITFILIPISKAAGQKLYTLEDIAAGIVMILILCCKKKQINSRSLIVK